MPEYNILSGGMAALRAEGYTEDFNLAENCLVNKAARLSADDFVIDKVYRYEGESDPDDEAALYAISSAKYGLKGLLVDGYGTTSDDSSEALLAKLSSA